MEQFLQVNGLTVAFVVLLLQQCGVPIPIPADLLLIAVAMGSARGDYPLPVAFVVMLVALLVGGLAHYGYARGPGRGLMDRFGKYMGLSPQRLDSAQMSIQRGGLRAILVGIATPVIRLALMWAAGLARFPFTRYLIGLFVGCILYVGWHFLIGYLGGSMLSQLMTFTRAHVVFVILIVGVGLGAATWIRRARAATKNKNETESEKLPEQTVVSASQAAPQETQAVQTNELRAVADDGESRMPTMLDRLAGSDPFFRGLVLTAALVVLLAGLKMIAPVLNPFIFALVFTLLFLPLLRWLLKRGVPVSLAIFLVLLAVIAFAALQIGIIALSLSSLPEKLPEYRDLLAQRQSAMGAELQGDALLSGADQLLLVNGQALFEFVEGVMNQLAQIVSLAWVILAAIVLMLFETVGIGKKFQRAFGLGSLVERQIKNFANNTVGYLAVKAVNNIFVSSCAVVVLLIMNVDFAFLWGLLAFWLQFLPQFGLLIAMLPAIGLVWLTQGPAAALVLLIIVNIFNFVGDNVLQPRITANQLDVAVFPAFSAFVIGGFILGPVGALLNVPLLFIVKLMLESFDHTRWMGELMNAKEAQPAQKAAPASSVESSKGIIENGK